VKEIPERRRCIGLAVGGLWMIAISLVFIAWSLVAIETPAARLVLLGSCVLLGGLVLVSIVVIRAALSLPKSLAPRTQVGQQIWHRFAWVVGAEVLGFGVVNTILGATNNFELIPSLDLMIVGIHFFPLARLFRVPRYNIMGLLFCAIPIVTLLAVSKHFAVGQALAWFVVPSLGCGFVASIIAAAGLREAWKSITVLRTSVV
jgi:hypothetical protein